MIFSQEELDFLEQYQHYLESCAYNNHTAKKIKMFYINNAKYTDPEIFNSVKKKLNILSTIAPIGYHITSETVHKIGFHLDLFFLNNSKRFFKKILKNT